eukprot:1847007-Pleurochrysis_carterae.AAC.2
MIHEALSRKRWGTALRTPRLWEEDKLVTREGKIKTRPIAFHRILAEIGIAEWADIYDETTKEHYTMGDLCKKIGTKKNTRIVQEYSNVKRLHRRQLEEIEQLGTGDHMGETKRGDIEYTTGKAGQRAKAQSVDSDGKKADGGVLGGEEYLIKWDNGEQRCVNKLEVQNMNGTEAETVHRARELIVESTVTFAEHMRGYGMEARQQIWCHTWREFLKYTERGNRGETAKKNAKMT